MRERSIDDPRSDTNGARSGGGLPRRRVLAATGTTLAALGLAGCTGDGTATDPTSRETATETATDTPTATTTTTTTTTATTDTTPTRRPGAIGPMCRIDNDVDEFTVAACDSEIEGDQLVVTATIRNDGDRTVDLFGYGVGVSIYSTEEPDFDSRVASSAGIEGPDDDEFPPGETKEFTITVISIDDEVSIEDVKSYTVEVNCNNPDSGVYCG